ncbi:hypothetical protein M2454_000551 [Aequitasia blattaphilus]|uniref:Cell surface protein n=1 Tax=Aequitasia blattaphilus TaxID=2949332 RepID=A0ABT1E8S5_9FIRM|nr:cell surface protein [Aequitasia blattaphilus]MCP1102230.1 cell surface protein [Aequitasia blattaphilus]MCR8614870.1 cell surface protein [Aequitasia blattaphilus]
MKKIFLLFICCFILVGCESKKDITTAEVEEKTLPELVVGEGMFSFDTNSYPELIGFADYVIVGKVVEELLVEYESVTEVRQEDGTIKMEGIPFSNYLVYVEESIKGNIPADRNIKIKKMAGLSEDGTKCYLFSDDVLPIEGNRYVFFIQAEQEGTNIVGGPNSTIPLDDNQKEITTTRSFISSEQANNIEDEIKRSVDVQVIDDRKRFVSDDAIE